MEEIRELLSSPAFWFSAVIISLLINPLGHFLVRYLESILAKFSKSWHDRSEKSRAERQAEIRRLEKDHYRRLIKDRCNKLRIRWQWTSFLAISFIILFATMTLIRINTKNQFYLMNTFEQANSSTVEQKNSDKAVNEFEKKVKISKVSSIILAVMNFLLCLQLFSDYFRSIYLHNLLIESSEQIFKQKES